MPSLYTCKTVDVSTWRIAKFDTNMALEASYVLDWDLCECPAGDKPTCRHRKMLKTFISAGHVNDGWFLDYDAKVWSKPLAELLSAGEPTACQPSPAKEGNGATIPSAPEGEPSPLPPSGATFVQLNQFCRIRRDA